MVKTFGWRCGVFLGKRGFVGLAAFFSRNEQETKQNEKEEKPKRSAAAGDDGRGGGAVSYGGGRRLCADEHRGCGCDFKKRAFRRGASGKHLVAECLHPDAHPPAAGVHGVFVRRDAVDFRRGDAERSAQSAGVELHAGRVLRRVAGRGVCAAAGRAAAADSDDDAAGCGLCAGAGGGAGGDGLECAV